MTGRPSAAPGAHDMAVVAGHGTRAYRVANNCGCERCKAAHTAYENDRNRQILYGRWEPYVDAEPARAHMKALMAAGMGRRTIAARAGISQTAAACLLYGKGSRPPTRRIRRATAEALLSVRAGIETLADSAAVDATGTVRRLRALVTIGYPQAHLAAELGVHPGNFSTLILRANHVLASRARAVRALYDRLWNIPGPSSRARADAARRGWFPPLAWNDDTIDDPSATPDVDGVDEEEVLRLLAGDLHVALRVDTSDRSPLRPSAVEAIRRLTGEGLTDAGISERLGGRISRSAIWSTRHRLGLTSSEDPQ